MEIQKENIIENPSSLMKPIESTNYRNITFDHNNFKYEIGISLYSNAIFIIITTNGKIGNLYTLDITSEQIIDSFNQSTEDRDRELETTQCLLGNRRDERCQFISNVLLTVLASKISLKSSKIQKLVLSLTLPNSNTEAEFELDEKNKQIIDILKEKLLTILDI